MLRKKKIKRMLNCLTVNFKMTVEVFYNILKSLKIERETCN